MVPLDSLGVGDIVLVRPGARVPADGTVTEGAADVDESMIMNAKSNPMVIIMTDGEEIRGGWMEWYDRNCLKINRDDKPNLLIQKQFIKYMFKQDEL